jgi:hypothetical protein
MNTPPSSSRHRRASISRRRPAPRAVPFKVFIGYADLVAVRHATSTIADAILSTGRHFQVQPMLWRYDQLANGHWRDRAIRAAQEADVVVLASSEPGGLSAGVEDWVNAFLAANLGRRATIVAVAGANDAWTISIEQPTRLETTAVSGLPFSVAVAEQELVLSRR